MEWFWIALKYWPFLAVSGILSMLGQFMSTKVFTKENAYAYLGTDRFGRFLRWFMYWGRESMPLHPIAAGFVIGKTWPNPAPGITSAQESMWFFAFAGLVSLFVWVVLKGKAKEHGIVLELPGDTIPPLATGAGDDLPKAPALPHESGIDSKTDL